MLLSHTTFPSQAMEPAAHLLGSSIEQGGFAKTTRDAHSSQPSALPQDTRTGSVSPRAQLPPHAGAITTAAGTWSAARDQWYHQNRQTSTAPPAEDIPLLTASGRDMFENTFLC